MRQVAQTARRVGPSCTLCAVLLTSALSACTLVETEAHLWPPPAERNDAGAPDLPELVSGPAYGGPGACDSTRCDDGLHCTVDVCIGGRCKHLLAPGACLIDGRCYAEGEAVTPDVCTQCAPAASFSRATFAAGAPCDDGRADTIADTCLAGSCRGFSVLSWVRAEGDRRTLLTGVAHVPRSKRVWAVGRYDGDDGHPAGLLVELDGAASPQQVLTAPRPFNAIHGQLAVGQGGQLRIYSTAPEPRWSDAPGLRRHLRAQHLYGVWSGFAGSAQQHWLAGDRGQLWRCSGDGGAATRCTTQLGLAGRLLRVAAVEGQSSAVWVLRGDSTADIFAGLPDGDLFSTAPPRGCHDDPAVGGACVDAPGSLTDLWVASSDEVWAVGSHGLVLRFQGSGWQRITIPTVQQPAQRDYDFRGVWADGGLVVLVGERRTPEEWQLIMVTYNARQRRWFPPRALFSLPDLPLARHHTHLLDVAGHGQQELYLVGTHWDAARQQQRALVMAATP